MINNSMDRYFQKESYFRGPSLWIGAVLLLALTVGLFWDVLFASDPPVLSRKETDLFLLFFHLRDFAFTQLREGNLALWNPYYFSGLPCLGSFQAAQFYPLNLVFLLPSITHAINWSIASHVFLTGFTMYLWSASRGLHPLASLFASVLTMFGGTYFMHVTPGTLPSLCAMAWAPLILLSIEGWIDKRAPGWILLGVFSVSMQILAGHPQYVFYTGITSVIYAVLNIAKGLRKVSATLGLMIIYVGAILLTAVQLFPGLEHAGESARGGGISFAFASIFSFPPENLLTLLVPGFFGDIHRVWYWGRCYLWETCPFFSVTGFFLALYGAFGVSGKKQRFSVTMSLILLVLALGSHTPLFRVLYDWVPGFDLFRGSSKFMFQACLFMVMLSATGLDHLIRTKNVRAPLRRIVLAAALLLAGSALLIHFEPLMGGNKNTIQFIMAAIANTRESYLAPSAVSDLTFVRAASELAVTCLSTASVTCLALWLLLAQVSAWRKSIYFIAGLGVMEVFVFAMLNRPVFRPELARVPALERFLAQYPGDYRILYTEHPNAPMSMKVSNIWGYDTPLRRYAEFMAFTQGQGPDGANEYREIRGYHPLHKLLRCRFHFMERGSHLLVYEVQDVMPRVSLVQDYIVIQERDRIFAAMSDPAFDPHQTVILENEPLPKPIKSNQKGTVKMTDSSTDFITIEVDTPVPSILLITDPYSRGWIARVLNGSTVETPPVMPADYILKAVALSAGRHSIRVEYSPAAFQVGKWFSILSALIYALVCALYLRGRSRGAGELKRRQRRSG